MGIKTLRRNSPPPVSLWTQVTTVDNLPIWKPPNFIVWWSHYNSTIKIYEHLKASLNKSKQNKERMLYHRYISTYKRLKMADVWFLSFKHERWFPKDAARIHEPELDTETSAEWFKRRWRLTIWLVVYISIHLKWYSLSAKRRRKVHRHCGSCDLTQTHTWPSLIIFRGAAWGSWQE